MCKCCAQSASTARTDLPESNDKRFRRLADCSGITDPLADAVVSTSKVRKDLRPSLSERGKKLTALRIYLIN